MEWNKILTVWSTFAEIIYRFHPHQAIFSLYQDQ
jgi:hypothetical protein